MQRKTLSSRRLSFDRLEDRNLLSVSAVAGAEDFVTPTADVYFGNTVKDTVVLQTYERDIGRKGAVVDLESNQLVPLSSLVPKELTVGEIWDNVVTRQNGDDIYFTTYDGDENYQLWVTNGSVEGTRFLTQSDSWFFMYPSFTEEEFLFFSTNREGWVTQGTVETTFRYASDDTRVLAKVALDDGVQVVTTSQTDEGLELWLADALVENSERMISSYPGAKVISHEHISGDDLYFTVDHGPTVGPRPLELHAVNLKSGDTHRIISKDAKYYGIDGFMDAGDRVLFWTSGGGQTSYWVSQGTPQTTIETSIVQGHYDFIVANDQLFYFTEMGELWKLESHSTVPELLWENLDRLRVHRPDVALLGEEVFFGESRFILRTDGTRSGTHVVDARGNQIVELPDRILSFGNRNQTIEVFESGAAVTQVPLYGKGGRLSFVTKVGDIAIVVIRGEQVGNQYQYKIYTTDGTQAGTFLLDSFQGFRAPAQQRFAANAETVVFAGPFEDAISTLWRIDYEAIADINSDSRLDALDIDALSAAIASGADAPEFDINRDEQVDATDKTELIEHFAETKPGDTNLDRRVDFADFLAMSSNFGRADAVGWAAGDFNGDSKVDIEDFFALAANFGFDRYV